MRQLLYQLYYTRYQVSFYLYQMGPLLKHSKVPKYYDQDYLKIFFLLCIIPVMIPIFGNSAYLAQKS